jgi:hypothetical protein
LKRKSFQFSEFSLKRKSFQFSEFSFQVAAEPRDTDDTTEVPGGTEEAHRRWPEGIAKRAASKAKVVPPRAEQSGSDKQSPSGFFCEFIL